MAPKAGDRKGTPKAPRHRENLLKRKRDEEEDLGQLQQAVDNLDPKADSISQFTDLPLSPPTARGLRDSHFETLTDIQTRAIPIALKGSDILGAAKTGSGKTLAFIVPLLDKLYRERWTELDTLGALVLSPTRELAVQTFQVLRKVGRHHAFSAGLVIGGKNHREEAAQIGRMNILVATPGRILHHLDQTAGFSVDSLQMLVLDEADRIMDMGFQKDVDALIEHLPKSRQTLLFSATQSKKVSDLARLSLKDPEYISVHEAAAAATPSTLQQYYVVTPLPEKLNTLWGFIKSNLKHRIVVFLSSGKQVRFIYESFRRMQPGIPLLHLHGRQKQLARLEITANFANAKHACLIATDVVARGVDFPSVDWVVQVDAPEDADTYIHRVGRTARYEKEGQAVLLLDPSEEEGMLKRLQQKKVPIEKKNPREKKKKDIRNELQSMCFKNHDVKYLAQKAFVSYTRSINLQKDKEIFKLNELDLDGFASSLGLAGAPQIKFQKGEDVKRLKNASRTAALSSGSEDDESGGDGEDLAVKKKKKSSKDEVRTKAQKMFERTNQDVLSQHYRNLVEDSEDQNGDDDFLKPKRVLRGNELDEAAAAGARDQGATPTTAKVLDLGKDRQLVLDSKRREKLVKSKKQMLKFRGTGTKLVFDDEGNAHAPYELQDEEGFKKQGPAEELRQRFVDAEADKVREADLDDKGLARQRRRERTLKRKARERGEAAPDGADDDDGGGYQVTVAGGGEEVDSLEFLRSLPIAGGGGRGRRTRDDGEEEEDDARPAKKPRKWFQKDEDDDSDDEKPKKRRKGPKVIEVDHEPDTLEDYEALAAGLLDDN